MCHKLQVLKSDDTKRECAVRLVLMRKCISGIPLLSESWYHVLCYAALLGSKAIFVMVKRMDEAFSFGYCTTLLAPIPATFLKKQGSQVAANLFPTTSQRQHLEPSLIVGEDRDLMIVDWHLM